MSIDNELWFKNPLKIKMLYDVVNVRNVSVFLLLSAKSEQSLQAVPGLHKGSFIGVYQFSFVRKVNFL